VILEPVAGIVLLTLLFMLISRTPPLGTNFPLFYATGMLPFTMYITLSGNIANAVSFSKALLTYPAVSFMDALLARFFLTAITQLLVMALVLGSIIVLYDLKLVISWGPVIAAIGMVLALSLSVGVANCYLFERFPLWRNFWNIMNRPLFLLSGVIFLPEMLPKAAMQYFVWNPLIHPIGMLRRGFYPTYDALYVSPVYVCVFSLLVGMVGLWFLLRYHKDLALL
jgi:capsular polysaccharide transport system permease protein